jgi:hypothetical protein
MTAAPWNSQVLAAIGDGMNAAQFEIIDAIMTRLWTLWQRAGDRAAQSHDEAAETVLKAITGLAKRACRPAT